MEIRIICGVKIYQIWKITNNEMDDNKNYVSEISLDVMAAVPPAAAVSDGDGLHQDNILD